MLAITSSRPPQLTQRSISIANTRLSRCAQLIATCASRGGASSAPSRRRTTRPRPAGVIAARSAAPGLYKRGGVWHIDKHIRGYGRISESCRTGSLLEAEQYLAHRLEEIRQATVYGVRPTRTFREAATKYLRENVHKRSIARDAQDLRSLDPFIGDVALDRIHDGTLQPFVHARKRTTRPGTINRSIAVVRRILNLAARRWRDEAGLSWLPTVPLLSFVPDEHPRQPYPISWDEQTRLFQALPPHLARMALFKVNTGTREQEVVQLRWDWEYPVPELGTSVFVVPRSLVKNKEDRLVVLNDVARSVIEEVRGGHPERVFTYKGKPVGRIYNSAWKHARERAGLPNLRVHDLKHTFGRRLRAAGVSFEDRQDLLGHKSGRITTHYSAAELGSLIEAANRVCRTESRKSPAMTLIRTRAGAASV